MRVDESYADVRVVGGENSLEEHPVTEGLALMRQSSILTDSAFLGVRKHTWVWA